MSKRYVVFRAAGGCLGQGPGAAGLRLLRGRVNEPARLDASHGSVLRSTYSGTGADAECDGHFVVTAIVTRSVTTRPMGNVPRVPTDNRTPTPMVIRSVRAIPMCDGFDATAFQLHHPGPSGLV
jgi:hypothetical protein